VASGWVVVGFPVGCGWIPTVVTGAGQPEQMRRPGHIRLALSTRSCHLRCTVLFEQPPLMPPQWSPSARRRKSPQWFGLRREAAEVVVHDQDFLDVMREYCVADQMIDGRRAGNRNAATDQSVPARLSSISSRYLLSPRNHNERTKCCHNRAVP